MAEPTTNDILLELREGHAKINGRLDVGAAEMGHLRSDVKTLSKKVEINGHTAKEANEGVAKLRAEMEGGITVIKFLVWFGVPAAIVTSVAAWFKGGSNG